MALFLAVSGILMDYPHVAASEEAIPANKLPALSLSDAEPIARKALIESMRAVDAARYHCIRICAGEKYEELHELPRNITDWDAQFETKDGDAREVTVESSNQKAYVGRQYGLAEPLLPVQPFGHGLNAAWERLGPNKARYVCIRAYYSEEAADWNYRFQDVDGLFSSVGVSADGNVTGFEETAIKGAAAGGRQILERDARSAG